MDVKIIPCDKEYIEKAIELTYIAWQPIYDGFRKSLGEKMFNDLYMDWKEVKYNRVYTGLTSGRGYVALVDGEFAGFIFYKIDEAIKLGTVEENAVDPRYRGLGIAGKLYDFVFDKMRSEGMRYTVVSTGLDDAHAPARYAYAKAGFNKSIEKVSYYMELFDDNNKK